MRKVFVSYSRKNLEVVTQLIQDMQAVGIDTWHDQTLTGGQRWWDNILSNIRECDVFIAAMSPESKESEACKSELTYAVQLAKMILPVLVADGINLNLLPPPLHEIQVTDYRGRDKTAAFALIKCINVAAPNPPLPNPLPAPPPVPISYLGNLAERIDSSQPLDAQEQITLLFELEESLQQGRSPAEVRDLLLRFRRRDELLAKIAGKIDAALASLEQQTPEPAFNNAAFGAAVSSNSRQTVTPRDDRPAFGGRFCPRCNAAANPGALFCKSCGASLSQQQNPPSASAPAQQNYTSQVARSKTRRYVCTTADSGRILSEVNTWLEGQGFESQQMPTESNSILLQIKKRGRWRNIVGMATSLNIVFQQTAGTLTVEIGEGKWVDKAAVGTVSLFILWPLAVTAGYGAWEQAKLPDKIFDFVGSRLACK